VKAEKEVRTTTRWVPMPPTYFWAAVAMMVALHFLWPGVKGLLARPWNWIGGAAVIIAGTALAWLPELQFKRVATEIKPFRESSHLVTDGLFRVSRNPMYLGMALALVGVFVVLASLTPAVMVPVFVVVMTVRFVLPEERDLERQFGDEYVEYTRRVRRWI